MSKPLYNRLLLTGATGALGSSLRPRLAALCRVLRVADMVDPGPAAAHEEAIVAPLQNRDAVFAATEGVDAVVHFGGVMAERWPALLDANVIGLYNLYEAARIRGIKRIVQASSNHATGFHLSSDLIGGDCAHRPDSLYGLTKCFGEDIARLYFDRYGIETACLRIGSAFPEPRDLRMLATWISYGDLYRLVSACLTAPAVGHTVIYGVSNNSASYWDNSGAAHIGYTPQDSADHYRAALEAKFPPLDPSDEAVIRQGGTFVRVMEG